MSFYLSNNDGKWNPWLVLFFGPQENPPYAATNLVLKLQFRLLSLQIPLFLAHFHKFQFLKMKNNNW